MKKLNAKEKSFCMAYAFCGNAGEAAALAGYSGDLRLCGAMLLEKEAVQSELDRLYALQKKQAGFLAVTGYNRLAFGNIADAVSLLFSQELTREQLCNMDLFSVSEIKKPKDGSVEIKFFDRLKALERLEQLSGGGDGASQFYNALRLGAQAQMSGDGDDV